ncbi:MAG: PEP-CTERM sorting domain-containing protein [Burkholderiales bacterium]|nr:PEP-CTERM sorting domain-containing protein [Burkholderiales bacterium]MBI3792066.1 PEP-CTERM sorting domain-containing protein [Gemmatimonadota bacterium]
MRALRLALAGLTLAAATSTAGAQATAVDMKFIGIGNPNAIVGNVWGGVYTAQAGGTITSGGGYIGGHTIDIVCVDMLNDVNYGQQYHAWEQALSATMNRSLLRWGGYADWYTRYKEAAWLSQQFNGKANGSMDVKAIHTAIWRTFTSAQADQIPVAGYGDQTVWAAAQGWMSQAAAAVAQIDVTSPNYWSQFVVISDQAETGAGTGATWAPLTGGTQEFLSTVPEPASIALMATGLLGVGFVGKRRRKK